MSSINPNPSGELQPMRKRRKCGHCGKEGHDKRTCESLEEERRCSHTNSATEPRNPPENVQQPAATQPVPHEDISQIDIESVLYIVFDIETTGFSKDRHHIIEIAAQTLAPNGEAIEGETFKSFVKPPTPIPPQISELTGITNRDVSGAAAFPEVATRFFNFMRFQAFQYMSDHDKQIKNVVLVAHNGKRFDIPFLMASLERYKISHLWLEESKFGFSIDTLELSRKGVQSVASRNVPASYSLGALYQFITGNTLVSAHRAMSDVEATIYVLRHHPFWSQRKFCLFAIKSQATIQVAMEYDSDSTNGEEDGIVSKEQEEDNEEESTSSSSSEEPLGDVWERGVDFEPPLPTPADLFEQNFTRRSNKIKTGLQCAIGSVNSPTKAWKQIFTNSILDKIVKYTNEYGEIMAKSWTNMTRDDLMDFICVLFVASVQKRKDKPSNWFSNNRILELPICKKITSGRKFLTMLRYIHCCSVEHQPTGDDYDPTYKVAELKEYLEKRYSRLFLPSQQLSLDETLIRSFGRMKFKVRIVTKAARYGIKVYVITDAATSYVLRVLIYTGKFTYGESFDESMKKTVQVVKHLCEPFSKTYRTIYVDRFYTSVELLKELKKMDLYMTGTVMKNRLPVNLRIAKTSPTFKSMERGDYKRHRLKYKDENGQNSYAGLVCWHDRDIVYCLTNDTNTQDTDHCHRRSKDGLIQLTRPKVISKYNRYMGGVDVADMRRLHCNSTIMGQNRWWLKLFFYLLDVGTSNALVLYNEAVDLSGWSKDNKMNIVEFKMNLIESFCGSKLDGGRVERSPEQRHVPERSNSRNRCAYCALFSMNQQTRFRCSVCDVPLCTVGSGRVNQDCFVLCHENKTTRQLVIRKFEGMKKNTNELSLS